MNLIDLTGQRFGRLVVKERAANIGRQTAWLCICDCGKEKVVQGWNLKSGQCSSCGCYASEVWATKCRKIATTHGQSYTRLYTTWIGMKQRCYYTKHKHFQDYGGRGITVCDEWKNDFEAFYEWAMGNGYSDTLTIDRIDVNGCYSPTNCRWVTYKTQNSNTRANRLLTLNGETHTLSEWSSLTGIPRSTITNRIKRGKTTKEALTKTP